MPTRGNPIRRMSGIFLRLLSSIVCHYVQTIEDNKLRESLHTNRASFAIALGKSVAADLLRFDDKSAHQVRSSTSVCFITCEFESRYLHQKKLRMKSSWLFIYTQIERAVPTGPKRHTVQQMISANRNCSFWAIALGKSVAADLLRFADKSAHQVRSCSSDRTFIVCEVKNK